MATIIVAGAIGNKYLKAGEVWHRLSWILGLIRLGFEVLFCEQITAANCRDSAGSPVEFERSVNRAWFRQIMEEFGLTDSAALIFDDGGRTEGLAWPELLRRAEGAELLVNISGHLTLESLLRRIRRKVYIDEDPGFTQFWHAEAYADLNLEHHDAHFTIGENIGRPSCPIPTGGIHWRPTRPIVILDQWPVSRVGDRERFTTIAGWRGPYGPIRYAEKTFGLKVHEFRKFLELPARSGLAFELALDIDPADQRDRDLLHDHGWHVVDPRAVVPAPGSFRRYIQSSGAEFSVAKGIYVETASGWFSDRTVRYLASGKPVLVQDTGFTRNYPTGEGLVAFRTLDDAIEGARRIVRDYVGHCQAARALAEEYFDSDRVLGRLLDQVGVKP